MRRKRDRLKILYIVLSSILLGVVEIRPSQAQNSWTSKTPMPTERLDSVSAVVDGKIYVIGGWIPPQGAMTNKVEVYDPAIDEWTEEIPHLPDSVVHTACGVVDGKIYVIGGQWSNYPMTAGFVYDPLIGEWTSIPPMLTPRYGHSIGVVNGKIYVIGGYGSAAGYKNEMYDPSIQEWTTKKPMPTTWRDHLGVAVVNDKIYVIGGRHGYTSDPLGLNEMYDPATDNWIPKAPMLTARAGFYELAVVDNKIYVMGGENGITNSVYSENEMYDPEIDEWTALAPLLTPRHGMSIQAVNNKIYTIGGGKNAYYDWSNINEEYTPPLQDDIVVSVSDTSGYPGQADIPVTISVNDIGAQEIFAINLVLTYDANLIQAQEVTTGTLTPDWTLIFDTGTAGQVSITLFDINPLPSGEGSIAEVSFDVLPTASPGAVSNLTLTQADFDEEPADIISNGSFTILGGLNQPPVLEPIGDKQVNEGVLLVFNITATDPDGDPLSYSTSNLPAGASFDPLTQVFSWTPDYTQAGIYPGVLFEVTDGSLTDSEDITIVVMDAGQSPQASISANPTQGEEPLTVNFDGSSSYDPDGTIVSYSWDFGDGYTASGITTSHTYGYGGTYTAALTVTDNDGLTNTDTVTITVREPISVEIKFDKDRISKVETLHITGETREGAVIEEVKVLDEKDKVLDIDTKGKVSISGEGDIAGEIVVKDIVEKYPLVTGIKIRVKVREGDETAEGETGVARIEPYRGGPDKIELKCYNNVFNPIKGEEAVIKVELNEGGRIKLNLYNARGEKIKELADEEKDAEIYKYYWDGKDNSGNVVGSGVYFVHIQAGDYKKTKKIVVVK